MSGNDYSSHLDARRRWFAAQPYVEHVRDAHPFLRQARHHIPVMEFNDECSPFMRWVRNYAPFPEYDLPSGTQVSARKHNDRWLITFTYHGQQFQSIADPHSPPPPGLS